jgi:hypothetical protein
MALFRVEWACAELLQGGPCECGGDEFIARLSDVEAAAAIERTGCPACGGDVAVFSATPVEVVGLGR